MAKKFFTDESLSALISEIKTFVISAVSGKADTSHNHAASEITSGTISADRLPSSTTSAKGVVQLTNSTSSTSTTTAATPNSVKSAYDLANSAKSSADAKVPTTRTINGKALSENISLNASDVGALPNNTVIPVIKEADAGTINLTWDGVVGDNDSFALGTWTYYKISSLTPEYNSITSGYTFRSNGMQNAAIAEHVNCYAIGDALVVTAAGAGSKSGNQFVATSTGIYFGRMSSWYTDELKMNCDIPYTSLAVSTSNGTQYKISVDNTKTLSVTNMDDGSMASMIKAPSTATIGQAIVVAEVDGSGRPVEYNAVNMPSLDDVATKDYVDEHVNTAQAKADSAYTLAEGKVDSLSDLGITATAAELNYMDGVTSGVQAQLDGKAKSDHTHNYAGSSSAGGAATSANKVNKSLTIQLNSGSTEGSNKFTFNGSTAKSINITASSIGASASGHNHDDYAKTADLDSVAFNGYVTKGAESGSTIGQNATVEGVNNRASSKQSHAEGGYTRAGNLTIYSEFNGSYDSYGYEHAEGYSTLAKGNSAHAEGAYTQAISSMSHAEGLSTVASGTGSHAEGKETTASGYNAHTEGYKTTASGENTHAEGNGTTASLQAAHAEGYNTTASGYASHAEGYNTKASSSYQHVQGKNNIEDTSSIYAHIVGNGKSTSERSNAHTIDWNGNAWFAGDIYIGGTGQNDPNAKKLSFDEITLITVDDIDEICGASIQVANLSEVEF